MILAQLVSKLRGQHRLYRYGTSGLHYFDDRTLSEKIFDSLEQFAKRYDARPRSYRRARWHPFLDVATGTMIESMSDIKRIEREKGYVYMDKRDIEKEAKFQAKCNEERQHRMVKRDIGEIYHKVKQGYSYTKEIRDKMDKGEYQIGQREAMNG